MQFYIQSPAPGCISQMYFCHCIFSTTSFSQLLFLSTIFLKKKLTRPHFLCLSLVFHIQTYDMVVFLSDPGLLVRSICLIVSNKVSEWVSEWASEWVSEWVSELHLWNFRISSSKKNLLEIFLLAQKNLRQNGFILLDSKLGPVILKPMLGTKIWTQNLGQKSELKTWEQKSEIEAWNKNLNSKLGTKIYKSATMRLKNISIVFFHHALVTGVLCRVTMRTLLL